jgi:hypothetical protein
MHGNAYKMMGFKSWKTGWKRREDESGSETNKKIEGRKRQ